MTESLCRMAETRYGIKPDPDDIEKLKNHLKNITGSPIDSNVFERFFSSGEAASFLTVNETYFFREPAHFLLLREMLPSFNQSMVRICSAASSVGCEAYSIAMLMDMYNRTSDKTLDYQIDAFDINPNVIETAHAGIYGLNSIREDGSNFNYLSDTYLEKKDYKIYIDHKLKNNINFFVHNLLDEHKINFFDVIFFRNAFIYILPDYREKVLTNLVNALKENGILIMGVSETAGVNHHHLEQKIKQLMPQKEEIFFFQKNSVKKPALPDYLKNTLLKDSVPA